MKNLGEKETWAYPGTAQFNKYRPTTDVGKGWILVGAQQDLRLGMH